MGNQAERTEEQKPTWVTATCSRWITPRSSVAGREGFFSKRDDFV